MVAPIAIPGADQFVSQRPDQAPGCLLFQRLLFKLGTSISRPEECNFCTTLFSTSRVDFSQIKTTHCIVQALSAWHRSCAAFRAWEGLPISMSKRRRRLPGLSIIQAVEMSITARYSFCVAPPRVTVAARRTVWPTPLLGAGCRQPISD
jgi:hypothetical protein